MPLGPPGDPPVVYVPPARVGAQGGAWEKTGPPPGDSVPPSLEVPIMLLWAG